MQQKNYLPNMSYMRLLKNVFSFSVTEFCFVFFGYVSMFLVVQYSVYPMQGLFLPENSTFAALLFLPHGVRVVSIWVLRERAIIPLLAASLVIYRLFYWYAEPVYLNYLLVLTGTFCAYFAILFFDFGKIDLSIQNLSISHWRSLILLGFVASVFNAIGNSVILAAIIDKETQLRTLIYYLVGDTLGVIGFLVIILISLRIGRALAR